MEIVRKLFASRGWLVALWALIRACITAFLPNIPQPVLLSLDSFVAVTIVVYVGADVGVNVRRDRALRASQFGDHAG